MDDSNCWEDSSEDGSQRRTPEVSEEQKNLELQLFLGFIQSLLEKSGFYLPSHWENKRGFRKKHWDSVSCLENEQLN